jgi:hypothetical protein
MNEKFYALEKIKHGKYVCYQKIKNRLVVDGCIKSNIIVTVP